jgi:hypothetical protein
VAGNPGNVTLTDVTFANNKAVGGSAVGRWKNENKAVRIGKVMDRLSLK